MVQNSREHFVQPIKIKCLKYLIVVNVIFFVVTTLTCSIPVDDGRIYIYAYTRIIIKPLEGGSNSILNE